MLRNNFDVTIEFVLMRAGEKCSIQKLAEQGGISTSPLTYSCDVLCIELLHNL